MTVQPAPPPAVPRMTVQPAPPPSVPRITEQPLPPPGAPRRIVFGEEPVFLGGFETNIISPLLPKKKFHFSFSFFSKRIEEEGQGEG